MCALNEAGRKCICAVVRELRPVREGQWLRKSSKLQRQTGWWSKEYRHWAKQTSHGNATNHDRRNTFRTKVDSGRPTRSAVDFRTEVQLDENRNRSSGTQVRGGPHRRDLHRQERGEGARRVVQRRRGTHRHRLLHPARRAQHREEKVESSAVRKGVRRE